MFGFKKDNHEIEILRTYENGSESTIRIFNVAKKEINKRIKIQQDITRNVGGKCDIWVDGRKVAYTVI